MYFLLIFHIVRCSLSFCTLNRIIFSWKKLLLFSWAFLWRLKSLIGHFDRWHLLHFTQCVTLVRSFTKSKQTIFSCVWITCHHVLFPLWFSVSSYIYSLAFTAILTWTLFSFATEPIDFPAENKTFWQPVHSVNLTTALRQQQQPYSYIYPKAAHVFFLFFLPTFNVKFPCWLKDLTANWEPCLNLSPCYVPLWIPWPVTDGRVGCWIPAGLVILDFRMKLWFKGLWVFQSRVAKTIRIWHSVDLDHVSEKPRK